MLYRSKFISKLVNSIPGKRTLGLYRFIPVFFLVGGCIEYCMIHWHVGEVNFYKVYLRKEARKIAMRELDEDSIVRVD